MCKRGWEFGYYIVEEDGKIFVRVGLARSYESAMKWLERVL